MKTLQTKSDKLTLRSHQGRVVRPDKKDETKAGVIIISVSLGEYSFTYYFSYKVMLFNFHFGFQADWLLKEYLDATMRFGVFLCRTRGFGFEFS